MPLSRKKSCVRCRHAKARCDLAQPACSRCRLRNHDCAYEGESRVSPLDWPPASGDAAFGRFQEIGTPDPDETLTSTLLLDAQSDLDWLHEDHDFNNTLKVLGPQATGMPFDQRTSQLLTMDDEPLAADPLMLDDISPSASTSNSSPLQLQTMRPTARGTLQRRQILKHSILSSIVIGQMTSYPKMMIQGDTLPPFISPPCCLQEHLAPECAESGYHRCLPEDLAVCTSLVRMYYERTSANAGFVWKSIYAECERLHAKYSEHNINRKLSILQALLIYIILQADDAASAEANGSAALLRMIVDMAYELSDTIVWAGEVPRHRPERADWVYGESLGRVMILLGCMDLVLDGVRPPHQLQSPNMVCGGFCAFPLPSHRDLWHARSNRAWRAAYDRVLSSRRGTKLLTASELVQYESQGMLDGTNISNDVPADVADIARWAEGLDQLGTLVWMILPFQKWRRQEIEASWGKTIYPEDFTRPIEG